MVALDTDDPSRLRDCERAAGKGRGAGNFVSASRNIAIPLIEAL